MTYELNTNEIEAVSGGINPALLPAIIIYIPEVLEEMGIETSAKTDAE